MLRGTTTAIVATAAALGMLAPAATALEYAPVDRPGPPLTVPKDKLDASLACSGGLASADHAPVLLLPATGLTPEANYSWNWERRLSALGVPWCALELPGHALGDIQVAGEHVVHAIRTMHERSGSRISIIGHSQGAMVPRWAFRFWPDTRAMVDDQIGFAAGNHGTVSLIPVCLPGCAPAYQQQRSDAAFIHALNSAQETFAGISYTEIYTRTDVIAFPNLDDTGTSSLHGGGGEISNVAIQEVCPLHLTEHLLIGIDSATHALAIDALEHPGPADPSRIAAGACRRLLMPGLNRARFAVDLASSLTTLARSVATHPRVAREPPLACYVLEAGC